MVVFSFAFFGEAVEPILVVVTTVLILQDTVMGVKKGNKQTEG